MDIYKKLDENLQIRIMNKYKKQYFKSNIKQEIENKYKNKLKEKLFEIYYNIFDEYEYLYYISLLETDILYYFNDGNCFRSEMNTKLQDFLFRIFKKKKIINYKDYIVITNYLFKIDLVELFIKNMTIHEFDDFYESRQKFP